VLKAEILRGN